MSAATGQEDSVSVRFFCCLCIFCISFYYLILSYNLAIAKANHLFKDNFHPDIRSELFRVRTNFCWNDLPGIMVESL